MLQCLLVAGVYADNSTSAPADASNAANTGATLNVDATDTVSVDGAVDLYLETTLNGTDRGLAHFGYRDGQLWASTTTLRRLGFILPADTANPVQLTNLPGVHASYEEQSQTATLVAPLKLLQLTTQVLNTRDSPAPVATTTPGLLLNYNLYDAESQQGNNSLSAYTELRAFSPWGIASNTMLTQMSDGSGVNTNHTIRMDTAWSLSFPQDMLTLNVGDTLTAATSWSRATRIGGIQFGTNFALQPYTITTPLPQFMGSATLPSNVELYVDGIKQYSGSVPTGPFQLNSMPGISGAGNAQVVLTNALGQITTLNFSLYGTQQLLRQGMTDWSTEVGFVRENYGIDSFDYDHQPMASGTWRYGVSNNLTADAHAEAGNGVNNAGIGSEWLVGSAGVLSGSAAGSNHDGHIGSQFSFGYNWTNNRFNVAVNAIQANAGYRDVASQISGPPPRLSASAQAGFNTQLLGSFGVSYVHLNYQQQINRYANLFWFRQLGHHGTINFSVNQSLTQSKDRSAFVNFSLSLDNRTMINSEFQHSGTSNTASVGITRSTDTAGGFGYHAVMDQDGTGTNGQAELDYLGRYGQVDVGVIDTYGKNTVYAGATGSVVLMGGAVFASRSIYNGFAVVSTDGVPDVPVKLQNNLVGTTDSSGLLLVTQLNAYQQNKISIDPMQLPANMHIDQVETTATPTDRAGTMVHFGISPIRAATIVLVDANGKPLPVGTTVHLNGSGTPSLVGFDGIVYFDTLDLHNTLDASSTIGHCRASFDYPEVTGSVPQIGPLRCTEGATP